MTIVYAVVDKLLHLAYFVFMIGNLFGSNYAIKVLVSTRLSTRFLRVF